MRFQPSSKILECRREPTASGHGSFFCVRLQQSPYQTFTGPTKERNNPEHNPMIPPQPTQINWPAIGIFVGAVINIIGWFVYHYLAKRRERQRDVEARGRDSDLAKSDFTAIVKKWLDVIGDRQQITLAGIRAKSIPEIEQSIRMIRPHLNSATKSRLEDEWKKYQQLDKSQLDGIQTRHSVTGNTITSYDDARRILSEPLKKMLEAIHPPPSRRSVHPIGRVSGRL